MVHLKTFLLWLLTSDNLVLVEDYFSKEEKEKYIKWKKALKCERLKVDINENMSKTV